MPANVLVSWRMAQIINVKEVLLAIKTCVCVWWQWVGVWGDVSGCLRSGGWTRGCHEGAGDVWWWWWWVDVTGSRRRVRSVNNCTTVTSSVNTSPPVTAVWSPRQRVPPIWCRAFIYTLSSTFKRAGLILSHESPGWRSDNYTLRTI